MLKRELGNTGLAVTELCFGVLPMGPLQFGLPAEKGGELIAAAIRGGVNFVDTAQSYKTYEHLRKAFDLLPDRGRDVIISTKSAATTYQDMAKAVEEARSALGRDVIDVFFLHAARVGGAVFEERAGAFECLQDMKAKGVVRAAGVSTHSVQVVRRGAEVAGLDVIFPIINIEGMGILHGTRDEMAAAIENAAAHGKGLFAMKALGGGNLIAGAEKAFGYVRSLPGITSVAVGMVSRDELEMNLKVFEGERVPQDLAARTARSKALIVQAFCKGCGTCVGTCPNGAMTVVNGKAVNDKSKCILCGYCAPVCPEFAIRMV